MSFFNIACLSLLMLKSALQKTHLKTMLHISCIHALPTNIYTCLIRHLSTHINTVSSANRVQVINTNFTYNHGSTGGQQDYGAAISVSMSNYLNSARYNEITNWWFNFNVIGLCVRRDDPCILLCSMQHVFTHHSFPPQ